MNTKWKLFKVMLLSAVFIASGFVSCGKKYDNSTADNEIGDADIVTIAENDLTENDEDLLRVDYKEFYDELAPHGEWIEVTDKDLHLKMKKSSASGENGNRSISISDFFGVKDAHAYDDVSFGAFFVWKPAPNLAVGLSVTEPEPYYVPYSNGQWLYTNAGWYFRAATPYEETVHHYGRWVFSPSLGWIWVPGRVRSPAWVDWREDDFYIGWAPIPPSVYIVNNVVIVPPIYEERYIVVDRRHFCEPYIYKHHHKHHRYRVSEWYRPEGIVVVNNTLQNHGPDIVRIQNTLGRTVNTVSISTVKNRNDIKYTDNQISVYSPNFKKVKSEKKLNSSFTKPGKYNSYGETSSRSKGLDENTGKKEMDQRGKDYDNSQTDKSNKGDLKKNERLNKDGSNKKYDNGENKKFSNGDDSNMKDGRNRDKGNNKGNDNRVKEKGKDNNNKGTKDNSRGNKKFRNENNKSKEKGRDSYNNGGKDRSKDNRKFRNEYNSNDKQKGKYSYDKGGKDRSNGNKQFRKEYKGNDKQKDTDIQKKGGNQRDSDRQKRKK